ncbi:hypothetical protein WJX81_004513 [Elliptochloris bilobata]|uniref:Cytochrome b5 heme-binding domain-containing protein n=1 Tax=Elliptochloris bilobata TaxID=381761 RepID=A0AAW1REA4_9CHLO
MCREGLPQAGLLKSSTRAVLRALDSVVGSVAEFNKCAALAAEAPRGSKQAPESRPRSRRDSFTLEEVAQHSSEGDAWLVVKNRVYDVTAFWPVHPGGRVILTYAGRDATDVFATFHAAASWALLHEHRIGKLAAEDVAATPALLADFRDLRARLQAEGLFRASKAYYAWKAASTCALAATAVAVLAACGGTWAGVVASAALLALFWQQAGWLAHDFLHHQVFAARRLNNAAGYFLGNVCQGFSTDWWKSKHNTHHAAPNELAPGNGGAVDPDIDTLPLLAWSEGMLDALASARVRRLLRAQHYYFVPILMLARLAWAQQSVEHAWRLGKAGRGWGELGLIGLHYSWTAGVAFACLAPMQAIAYLLLGQVLCGLLLSIVFVQSHNGMEVYSGSKDFVTAQVVSTRDILSTPWTDWFTGGLNYQVEHHLFPTLPRHRLGAVAPRVAALCAQHGLAYEACGMAEGMRRVLACLASVARLA